MLRKITKEEFKAYWLKRRAFIKRNVNRVNLGEIDFDKYFEELYGDIKYYTPKEALERYACATRHFLENGGIEELVDTNKIYNYCIDAGGDVEIMKLLWDVVYNYVDFPFKHEEWGIEYRKFIGYDGIDLDNL